MKAVAIVAAALFGLGMFANAWAHGDTRATHSGDVGQGSDAIAVEFVMEKGTLNVYVHDEAGKPLPMKNVTATLILVAPQRPAEEVTMVRVGADKFKAPGVKPARGDSLRARIKLPNGEEHESVASFSDRQPPAPSHRHADRASALPGSERSPRTQ